MEQISRRGFLDEGTQALSQLEVPTRPHRYKRSHVAIAVSPLADSIPPGQVASDLPRTRETLSMSRISDLRRALSVPLIAFAFSLTLGSCAPTFAGEPDPKSYWDVKNLRPGMKGSGRTVMVGTKLEEFGAEVLGVMRDVSPGRDMVLCRLTGCNLEHAGIIQGMSGSPIYIEGKLLGAVAFAWEFAKDPIAGVTPFKQMVEYVRSNDRRISAESQDRERPGSSGPLRTVRSSCSLMVSGLATDGSGFVEGLADERLAEVGKRVGMMAG